MLRPLTAPATLTARLAALLQCPPCPHCAPGRRRTSATGPLCPPCRRFLALPALDAPALPAQRRGRPPSGGGARTPREGPLLLVAVGPGAGARHALCPRVRRCEDDWVEGGREGQAGCASGCVVWAGDAAQRGSER